MRNTVVEEVRERSALNITMKTSSPDTSPGMFPFPLVNIPGTLFRRSGLYTFNKYIDYGYKQR